MTTTRTRSTRRSTSARLLGAAVIASLVLVCPAGAAMGQTRTSVASDQPAARGVAKVGAVQGRMSMAP